MSAYAKPPAVSPLMALTLAWLFMLASLALLGVLLVYVRHNPPPVETPPPPDWMKLIPAGTSPELFKPAPPIVLQRALFDAWPLPPADEEIEEDNVIPTAIESAPEYLRWSGFKGQRPRRDLEPRGIEYKITPSLNFENHDIQLNGLMIHFKVEF